ncbi:hypothetical protein [Paenibacillus sp. SI8]|uniref:hypothetical protein n=1 Tax=unclassified Paenibacillus TaxID=185978 RepID=UPI0034660EDF
MPPKRTRSRRANVEVTETTFLPSILKKIKGLTKQEVHIGVEGDEELAMIAGILEHGSKKMNIPARSFIGSGKKKSAAAISKLVRKGITELVHDQGDARRLLIDIGTTGKDRTLKNFDKIKSPPLSPIYARRKGSNKILVMEEHLRKAITFVVVRKGR